jgi:Domain of unknown function (DUF222)
MAWVTGSVFATDGQTLDRRLDELAGSVCDADPRSREQRRADALGALAAGAERLVCGCGSADCAATPAPKNNLVIHVIAEQASVEGTATTPGVLFGVEGHRPSAKLADFVRCRDLTCRAPGCDRPAISCDIDHTIPYPTAVPRMRRI